MCLELIPGWLVKFQYLMEFNYANKNQMFIIILLHKILKILIAFIS
jgi:hypothetical protein